jgi:hypothetical protein
MANQLRLNESNPLTLDEFETLLEVVRQALIERMRKEPFRNSPNFERAVRESLQTGLNASGSTIRVDFNSHAQAFPDICLGKFGIEVKYTENDTWRGVANSISQGMRDESVSTIYVMWCKEGGRIQDIMYRPYEDVVMHVRTSHVPRFEIDMETGESLFKRFKTSYKGFSALNMKDKMDLVRSYVTHRIRDGERRFFWFLESQEVDSRNKRTLRLFNELEPRHQVRLCLEELFLFSDAIQGDRQHEDLLDIRVRYFLNKHRVVYPQTLALYKAATRWGSAEEGESSIEGALMDDNLGAEVFSNIDLNSFRTHAEWWDGEESPDYNAWKLLYKERICRISCLKIE